ncbi:chemotaxis response regulator protein-glutamate methylesterase [Verrucomicrobia bacterium LW23]|nr:chemotaxis response regulator protein-glutamate methylesterase [Verrucomicrobia bacterium LW23]
MGGAAGASFNPRGGKVRVMIVDDSAIVRRMTSDLLASDPCIEVVGTAIDPITARDKLPSLRPDVLVLDIEMPRMDGITFLRSMRGPYPLPVVILSSITTQGSFSAMEALAVGAFDIVPKPGGPHSVADVGSELIRKIKACAQSRAAAGCGGVLEAMIPHESALLRGVGRAAPARPRGAGLMYRPVSLAQTRVRGGLPRSETAVRLARGGAGREGSASASALAAAVPPQKPALAIGRLAGFHPRQVIVIGASTGGTEALARILPALPEAMPPICIVQHIPAHFSRYFAERLNDLCRLEVREAVDGDAALPGRVLLAPGDYHMRLVWQEAHGGEAAGLRVRLDQSERVWHQRPAVDPLFASAAELCERRTLGVVLTGMGTDGAEGLKAIHEARGQTVAQNEASCVVFGMPRAAIALGAADHVLDIMAIAPFMEQRVRALLPG